MWTPLNELLLFIHSLLQSVNINQQSTVKPARVSVHIIVHTIQHSCEMLLLVLQTVIMAQGRVVR